MRKFITSVILLICAFSPLYSLSTFRDYGVSDSNEKAWNKNKTLSFSTMNEPREEEKVKITWKKGTYLFVLADEKNGLAAKAQAFKNPDGSITFKITDQDGKELGKIINDKFDSNYLSVSSHAVLFSAEGVPQLEDFIINYRMDGFIFPDNSSENSYVSHTLLEPSKISLAFPVGFMSVFSPYNYGSGLPEVTIDAGVVNLPYFTEAKIDLRNYILFLAIRAEVLNFKKDIIPLLPTAQ